VCYDEAHERGLWKRYDPERGCYVFLWARCIFALCRKLELAREHVTSTCTGFLGAGPTATVAQRMQRCGCPVAVKKERYVWLVEPRDRIVYQVWEPGKFRSITHGQDCQVLGPHVSPNSLRTTTNGPAAPAPVTTAALP
jgi:hypothetical protein